MMISLSQACLRAARRPGCASRRIARVVLGAYLSTHVRRTLTTVHTPSTPPAATSSNASSNAEEADDDDDLDALRTRILTQALRHVRSDGWSKEALASGAEDLKLLPAAHGLFQGGAIDLVYFAMEAATEHASQVLGAANLAALPVNDRIVLGVRSRIEWLAAYRVVWAQAMALGAQPQHLPGTLSRLGAAADELWWRAGDASTDLHWYSRRALLVSVLAASEVFMLTDASPGLQDTHEFIARRVADVATFGQGAGGALATAHAAASGVGSIIGAAVGLVAPVPASLFQWQGRRPQEREGSPAAAAAAAVTAAPQHVAAAVASAAAAAASSVEASRGASANPLQAALAATSAASAAFRDAALTAGPPPGFPDSGPGKAASAALRSAMPQLVPGGGGAVDSMAAALLPPTLSAAGGAVVRGLFGGLVRASATAPAPAASSASADGAGPAVPPAPLVETEAAGGRA